MTREEILKEALRCVTGEREQQYGSPEDSFEVIADLWMVYLTNRCVGGNADVCVSVEDVAAMMALLKIARICTGKYKSDSWVDLAGYAACGGACQSGNRPKEWEIKDEEDRRMGAKIEKVNAYCRLSEECELCPVWKNDDLRDLCRGKNFEAMDEGNLDRFLNFFQLVARRRRPSCYDCKHMACSNNDEPCRGCKYLDKYEENSDEQS